VPVYVWFIVNKLCATGSWFEYFCWWIEIVSIYIVVLAYSYRSWLQRTLPSIQFWALLYTELFSLMEKPQRAFPHFFESCVFGLAKFYWPYKSLEVPIRLFIHPGRPILPSFCKSTLGFSSSSFFPSQLPSATLMNLTQNPQLTLRLKQIFFGPQLTVEFWK